MDDSVIEIFDSPVLPTGNKRKRDEVENGEGEPSRPSPKHPLLESISNRFQQNQIDREIKNDEMQTKRQMEKVHSQYLKQNVVDPQEMAKASYAASHWAKKNGMKDSTLKPVKRNTGGAKSSPGKRKTQAHIHTEQKAPKNKSVRTSTVTSASHTVSRPGSSESLDTYSTFDGSRSAHNLKAPGDDGSGGNYICPVLYCEAKFTSEGSLGQHMSLFQHSPCNPCRYIRDCKLSPDPLCYKCPECDLEFSTGQLCRDHMNEAKHLVFYPPLAISAYLCPQCLYLFKTLETCWEHMEESKHHKISFPFKDDDSENDFVLPIAAAEEFVQNYMRKCKDVTFQVQCLDCDISIPKPRFLRDHQEETNYQHLISALTFSSQSEIFSTYIETFSCDTCHRLFSGQPGTDPRHICASNIVGHIKADQIPTMSDFVKCCALTEISSLKVGASKDMNLKVGKVSHTKKHGKADEFGAAAAIDVGTKRDKKRAFQSPENITEKRTDELSTSKRSKEEASTSSAVRYDPFELSSSESEDDIFELRIKKVPSDMIVLSDSDENVLSDSDENIELCIERDSTGQALISDRDGNEDPSIETDSTGQTPRRSERVKSMEASGKIKKKGKRKISGKLSKHELENMSKGQRKRYRKRMRLLSMQGNLRNVLAMQGNADVKNTTAENDEEAPGPKEAPGPSRTKKQIKKGMELVISAALRNQNEDLISAAHLGNMKNLIFLDYDNCAGFFTMLPHCPSDHTFVWAFYGGSTVISSRMLSETFHEMHRRGLVYISEQCGKTKDAADFAIVLTVGKMDERLPSSVAFTIISADKGFCEVVRQMKQSARSALLINPFKDRDILPTMLKSIVET